MLNKLHLGSDGPLFVCEQDRRYIFVLISRSCLKAKSNSKELCLGSPIMAITFPFDLPRSVPAI